MIQIVFCLDPKIPALFSKWILHWMNSLKPINRNLFVFHKYQNALQNMLIQQLTGCVCGFSVTGLGAEPRLLETGWKESNQIFLHYLPQAAFIKPIYFFCHFDWFPFLCIFSCQTLHSQNVLFLFSIYIYLLNKKTH